MYPEGILIDKSRKNLIVFEKDINNPNNEGFILFYDFREMKKKKLIFKQLLIKSIALKKWNNYLMKGWTKIEALNIAA
tara:strand:- start:1953 stop:2186 length:234 start_codon:yes stop_codon:yes gene_type:complete